MKNIRKIVSLVLCLAMVMAMSVMGISAEAGVGTKTYTMIDSVEELTAGTYKMAAYLTTSSSSVDLSANPYHLATGTIDSGDMVTASYSFTNGVLTAASDDNAADIELIAVAGKANTYYIKYNNQYLYSTESATNRKLAWGDTATEWVATNNSKGGITLSSNSVYLGSASATSKFLRSYKGESTPKYGVVFFKANPEVENTQDMIDTTGEHIRLSVHSLELKEQLHIRHFVHITDSSVEHSASTRWGLQYWTPEDYAALTLVDGQPAFDAEPTQEYDFIETATPNGEDDKYYATTGGIVAADINDVQYIRAYIVIGTTTYYTPVQAYSVSTYLSAVEDSPSYGVNSDLYKTVEALIAYGEAAAKLFG